MGKGPIMNWKPLGPIERQEQKIPQQRGLSTLQLLKLGIHSLPQNLCPAYFTNPGSQRSLERSSLSLLQSFPLAPPQVEMQVQAHLVVLSSSRHNSPTVGGVQRWGSLPFILAKVKLTMARCKEIDSDSLPVWGKKLRAHATDKGLAALATLHPSAHTMDTRKGHLFCICFQTLIVLFPAAISHN